MSDGFADTTMCVRLSDLAKMSKSERDATLTRIVEEAHKPAEFHCTVCRKAWRADETCVFCKQAADESSTT
jgi:hypothetical protein